MAQLTDHQLQRRERARTQSVEIPFLAANAEGCIRRFCTLSERVEESGVGLGAWREEAWGAGASAAVDHSAQRAGCGGVTWISKELQHKAR